MTDETPNVRIRVHDPDCEHCAGIREVDMTEDEAVARLARIMKERGRPAIVHTDDDGTEHVEYVDILDMLRSDLGEDARLLDEHLSTLSSEEIEQFRKDAYGTQVDQWAAALIKGNRRKRLRSFLDEQSPT